MECDYENNNSQDVTTEKVLPIVIKVEESNCLLCRRVRKFYSCRRCREDGHLCFLTQEFSTEKRDGREIVFPGVISGLTKFQVSELKKSHIALKDKEKIVLEATVSLGQRLKLRSNIIETKSRIEALKQMRRVQIEEMKKLQMDKKLVESTVEQLHRRSQRTQMKKSKITDYMNKKKEVVQKTQLSLMKENKELEIIRKRQVGDLVTHIFPIVGRSQEETLDSDKSSDDEHSKERSLNLLEEELAEARRLSFVHGRWIYDQREGPDLVQLSIASSRAHAPADGNYSACEAWLKSMLLSASVTQDTVETSTTSSVTDPPEPHRSPGASGYAALCHATHLMHTIRKVLSIHMPYKHHYRQFSNPDMTVQEFLWNVHKLNGNVLAFCLHYGVQTQLIHPLHTLPNIQNAVQMFLHNGASTPPSVLTPELVASLEEALEESSDPLPDDDEDKMEESLSEWEEEEDWESLIPKQFELVHHQYTSAAPFQSQAQQEDLGVSQGLMSSAAAYVTKGWSWWNK